MAYNNRKQFGAKDGEFGSREERQPLYASPYQNDDYDEDIFSEDEDEYEQNILAEGSYDEGSAMMSGSGMGGGASGSGSGMGSGPMNSGSGMMSGSGMGGGSAMSGSGMGGDSEFPYSNGGMSGVAQSYMGSGNQSFAGEEEEGCNWCLWGSIIAVITLLVGGFFVASKVSESFDYFEIFDHPPEEKTGDRGLTSGGEKIDNSKLTDDIRKAVEAALKAQAAAANPDGTNQETQVAESLLEISKKKYDNTVKLLKDIPKEIKTSMEMGDATTDILSEWGFHDDTPTSKDFWSIVKEMQKKEKAERQIYPFNKFGDSSNLKALDPKKPLPDVSQSYLVFEKVIGDEEPLQREEEKDESQAPKKDESQAQGANGEAAKPVGKQAAPSANGKIVLNAFIMVSMYQASGAVQNHAYVKDKTRVFEYGKVTRVMIFLAPEHKEQTCVHDLPALDGFLEHISNHQENIEDARKQGINFVLPRIELTKPGKGTVVPSKTIFVAINSEHDRFVLSRLNPTSLHNQAMLARALFHSEQVLGQVARPQDIRYIRGVVDFEKEVASGYGNILNETADEADMERYGGVQIEATDLNFISTPLNEITTYKFTAPDGTHDVKSHADNTAGRACADNASNVFTGTHANDLGDLEPHDTQSISGECIFMVRPIGLKWFIVHVPVAQISNLVINRIQNFTLIKVKLQQHGTLKQAADRTKCIALQKALKGYEHFHALSNHLEIGKPPLESLAMKITMNFADAFGFKTEKGLIEYHSEKNVTDIVEGEIQNKFGRKSGAVEAYTKRVTKMREYVNRISDHRSAMKTIHATAPANKADAVKHGKKIRDFVLLMGGKPENIRLVSKSHIFTGAIMDLFIAAIMNTYLDNDDTKWNTVLNKVKADVEKELKEQDQNMVRGLFDLDNHLLNVNDIEGLLNIMFTEETKKDIIPDASGGDEGQKMMKSVITKVSDLLTSDNHQAQTGYINNSFLQSSNGLFANLSNLQTTKGTKQKYEEGKDAEYQKTITPLVQKAFEVVLTRAMYEQFAIYTEVDAQIQNWPQDVTQKIVTQKIGEPTKLVQLVDLKESAAVKTTIIDPQNSELATKATAEFSYDLSALFAADVYVPDVTLAKVREKLAKLHSTNMYYNMLLNVKRDKGSYILNISSNQQWFEARGDSCAEKAKNFTVVGVTKQVMVPGTAPFDSISGDIRVNDNKSQVQEGVAYLGYLYTKQQMIAPLAKFYMKQLERVPNAPWLPRHSVMESSEFADVFNCLASNYTDTFNTLKLPALKDNQMASGSPNHEFVKSALLNGAGISIDESQDTRPDGESLKKLNEKSIEIIKKWTAENENADLQEIYDTANKLVADKFGDNLAYGLAFKMSGAPSDVKTLQRFTFDGLVQQTDTAGLVEVRKALPTDKITWDASLDPQRKKQDLYTNKIVNNNGIMIADTTLVGKVEVYNISITLFEALQITKDVDLKHLMNKIFVQTDEYKKDQPGHVFTQPAPANLKIGETWPVVV